MAHSGNEGFALVKVVDGLAGKTYIKAKQAPDISVKNWLPVMETTSGSKDYIEIVMVNYDTPKDYILVNFVDGSEPPTPTPTPTTRGAWTTSSDWVE